MCTSTRSTEHFRLEVFGVDKNTGTDDVIRHLKKEEALEGYDFALERRECVKHETCHTATITFRLTGPPTSVPIPQRLDMKVPGESAYFTMGLKRLRASRVRVQTPREAPPRRAKETSRPAPGDGPSPTKRMRTVSAAPVSPTPVIKTNLADSLSMTFRFENVSPSSQGRYSDSPVVFPAYSPPFHHHPADPSPIGDKKPITFYEPSIAAMYPGLLASAMNKAKDLRAHEAVMEAQLGLSRALEAAREKHVKRSRLIARAVEDAHVSASARVLKSATDSAVMQTLIKESVVV